MAELHIRLPSGATNRYRLTGVVQTIGRDAGCEIPVDDPSTSRRHARFVPTPQGFIVEDLGSKNGTLVNNAPCTPQTLRDGDEIVLGSVVVQFRDMAAHPPTSVVIADDVPASNATRYASRERQIILPQQRLQMIYDLSERLTTLRDQAGLLDEAMDICFETLQFERGAVGVRRQRGRGVDWPVVRNLRGAEGELTISRTLLSRALELGERAIFTAGDGRTADPTVSMVQHGIRSAMCVPFIHHDEVLGVIYGDRQTTSTVYTKEDIDFLAGIARQVSIGLINWRLLEEQQQMVRLKHDIEVARGIQGGLFPRALPENERIRVAAINDPGQRVSGDYYDLIELPDGRFWCLLADVTGEGVSAALLMANFQAVVRATIEECEDPGILLGRWNTIVCRNTSSSRFITCLLALVDPARRTIRMANAGHHSPMLVRERGVETLEVEASFPLGVVPHAEYPTGESQVGAEPFTLLVYTDGVIEALDPAGNIYGVDRMKKLLHDVRDINPVVLTRQLRKSVAGFVGEAPQSDDITILAARVS